MWESEFGSGAQIFDVRLLPVVPRGVGGTGPRHDDVGSHAVYTGRRADFGDLEQYRVSELDSGQDRLGPLNSDTKPLFGIRVLSSESLRVRVERQSSPHDLGALCRVPRCGNLDGQTEAVEQLGPQLALLGIHRPDEHELRRVGDRYAVALHADGPHGGRVEQEIDEMVVQQVDFVDVQDPAMRICQQTRLEVDGAVAQRLLEIDRTCDAILRRADGQLDQSHRPGFHGCVGFERAVR